MLIGISVSDAPEPLNGAVKPGFNTDMFLSKDLSFTIYCQYVSPRIFIVCNAEPAPLVS